ncbi:antibiotic biosynthesis monooxygenase [bacterium]|nr:antibiotic biosynthesis monooxygenase [bacterium]
MILRVVKMTFRPEEVEGFLEYLDTIKHKIESRPGLVNLRIYRDTNNKNVVFTLSTWLDSEHLNLYRKSELFAEVWPKTKALFSDKAEAWSLRLK